jgi:hypothetical protein
MCGRHKISPPRNQLIGYHYHGADPDISFVSGTLRFLERKSHKRFVLA